MENNYQELVLDFRQAFFHSLEEKANSVKHAVATDILKDWFTKGIRDTDLIYVTAKANAGKTTLMCQMAYDFAKSGVPVCFFSGETPIAELIEERFWGLVGLDPIMEFKGDGEATKAILTKVPELPLYLPNYQGKWEMRKDCIPFMKWIAKEHGVKIFFMDHLRFFLNSTDAQGQPIEQERLKYQDTSECNRLHAKDSQTTLIVAVQPAKTPVDAQFQGSSMYGSVAMEQDATVILQLERPLKAKKKGEENEDSHFEEWTRLTLFKNRNGKNGLIKRLKLDETTKRFKDYEDPLSQAKYEVKRFSQD